MNNRKLSFVDLLVFFSLIIIFAISGFILSEIIDYYEVIIWGPNHGFDNDVGMKRINEGGISSGVLVALWIFCLYYLWKNGNIEENRS
jgi:hypothetical protein